MVVKKTSNLLHREPCPVCRSRGGDSRGDNLAVYDDGHVFCYACTYFNQSPTEYYVVPKEYYRDPKEVVKNCKELLRDLKSPSVLKTPIEYIYNTSKGAQVDFSYQYLGDRGISRDTMEAYKVLTKVSQDGQPVAIAFPFGSYEQIRKIPGKQIITIGESTDVKLFGQDLFNPGSAQAITVTEGAYDAM